MRQVTKRNQNAILESRQEAQALATPGTAPAEDIARAQRIEALQGIFGLWKGRDDVPQDGLAYQLEIRAE